DVRQYVIRTYGASPDPARWGVAGLSEGGTCALTLTLRHPDLFSAVGDFSGELAPSLSGRADTLTRLFGGSPLTQRAYDPLTLLARQRFPGVAVWFEAGAADLRARVATRNPTGRRRRRPAPASHRRRAVPGSPWRQRPCSRRPDRGCIRAQLQAWSGNPAHVAKPAPLTLPVVALAPLWDPCLPSAAAHAASYSSNFT